MAGAAAGFTSTLPPRPQAMDLGYGAPYSHGDYGQRFESGSGAESGAGYGESMLQCTLHLIRRDIRHQQPSATQRLHTSRDVLSE